MQDARPPDKPGHVRFEILLTSQGEGFRKPARIGRFPMKDPTSPVDSASEWCFAIPNGNAHPPRDHRQEYRDVVWSLKFWPRYSECAALCLSAGAEGPDDRRYRVDPESHGRHRLRCCAEDVAQDERSRTPLTNKSMGQTTVIWMDVSVVVLFAVPIPLAKQTLRVTTTESRPLRTTTFDATSAPFLNSSQT